MKKHSLVSILGAMAGLAAAQGVHPLAEKRFDRGLLDADNGLYLTLHFRATPERQAALERFLEEQQDPASPNYRRWLTPEEFGDRFGASNSDVAVVADWLQARGLTVHGVARGRQWINAGGAAGKVAALFGTEIRRYERDGRIFYANAAPVRIPAEIGRVVQSVVGLDDFDGEPAHRRGPAPDFTATNGNHVLAPEDVAAIYNFNPLYQGGIDGSGQRIAIGGRTLIDTADFQAFRRRFNLPAGDLTLKVVPGSDPGVGTSDDIGESNLDVQWAGAMAPKASITLVYARSVVTAAQYAIDQNIAPVFSLSYGGCEQATSPTTLALYRAVAQQANAQGITFVASTGDVGAAGCERQETTSLATRGLGVQVPSILPEVTAVGGTEFDEGNGAYWRSANSANGGSATSYIPEKGWNDSLRLAGLASSTGGMSILFPKPAWQSGPGVPAVNARMAPDLSFAASWNHDAWLTYLNGILISEGGTSVATPVFAGALTLLNQALTTRGVLKQPGLGNINPALYRLAQSTSDVFHDVVTGDNIVPCSQGTPDCVDGSFGYQAGPGYDVVTGLGSLNIANFVNRWAAVPASSTSVTASPSSVPFNGTLTLTATVSGPASVAGTVNFLIGDAMLGSAELSGGTASLTVSAYKLPAGASTILAVYSGSTQLGVSSGSTQVTVTLPTGAAAVVPTLTPDVVYKGNPDSAGRAWTVTINLAERAGVGATMTSLRMLGTDYSSSIVQYFGRNTIPAKGSISALLTFFVADPPQTGQFVFGGVDSNGTAWTAQTSAQFLSQRQQQTWLTVVTSPGTAASQPSADSSCQFQDQVTVEENGGYFINLTKFTAGSNDLTSRVQNIFGTTHVAPYGTLSGTVCWSAAAPSSTYRFDGATESSATLSATGAVTAAAPLSGAGAFKVTPTSATMQVTGPAQTGDATIGLTFSDPLAKWSVSLMPANLTTKWLTVSPVAGTGSGGISLHASSTGLSKGVYRALVGITAPGALPQYIVVPVMFVVGTDGATQIGGVANGASFKAVVAPGMVLSVFGTNLAPGSTGATTLPLPISLQGVTATVNGITAPLYYVSPGQINMQVPYETGAGPATVGIDNNGHVAGWLTDVSVVAPGIFAGGGALVPYNNGSRGDVLLAFITGEGDLSPSLYTGRGPTTSVIANLPKPRLPVTVTVGGVNAQVDFAGIPPGLSGVTQINFHVPANAPTGDQDVVVTVGGVASPPVRLTVR